MPLDETTEGEDVEELGVSAAKGGGIFVSSKIITSVITAILLIFLTRFLKPADYGTYTIIIAFSTILGMGGNFGIGTALRKKIPEFRYGSERILEVINNGYFVALILALAITAVGIAASGSIATYIYHNPGMTGPLIVASVTVLLTVLFNVTIAVLVGLNKIKEAAFSNIIYGISQAAIVMLLVILGYGIFGAVLGIAISLAIGSIISIAYLERNIVYKVMKPKIDGIRELTAFSTPLIISNISVVGTTSLAIAFLGIFASASLVGSYGAAFKLGRLVEVLLTSTTFVLLPAFASALKNEHLSKRIEGIFNNSIYYMLLLLLPLVAYLVSIAKPLTDVLFSSAYAGASLYFSIIIIGLTIGTIGSFAGTLIISFGDTKKFMVYQGVTVIAEVVAMLVLIPYIKVFGALIALFVAGPLILDVLYIKALSKQFSITQKWRSLVRITVPAIITFAVMFIISYALHENIVTMAINLAVLVLLYPPLIALSRGINGRNIKFLKMVSKRFGRLESTLNALIRYTELFIKKDESLS